MHNRIILKSRENPRLKFARRVRDGKEKNHVFVEGHRLCDEALSSNLSIVSCLITDSFADSRSAGSLNTALAKRNVETFIVSEALFASVSDTKTPQGIVLIA